MSASKLAIDVVCVGHAAFDLTMEVDHHPGPDEKCSASSIITSGGGPAANAAVTVSRLGGRSAFAGYLGNDLYGCQHYEEFQTEGVILDWVVRGPCPTSLSIILVKPDGQRTVVNHKKQTPPLRNDQVDFSRCHPRVVLFDGHEPEISIPLAKTARAGNIPTILDAGSVHHGTIGLLPYTDYLVTSAKFARDFTGKEDPQQALDILSKRAPCVAITVGLKGVLWMSGERRGALPAFAVNVADTTGAGDTFHGALALAIAQGESLAAAMHYASAAAAICCTRVGARPGIPTRGELESFLESGQRFLFHG